MICREHIQYITTNSGRVDCVYYLIFVTVKVDFVKRRGSVVQHVSLDCTHILFGEVDNPLLEGHVFGLVGFAKLLENLCIKQIMTSGTKIGVSF